MKVTLDIARRQASDAPEYRQSFVFETDEEGATVATALRALNAQGKLLDADGNEAAPIQWECSCLQKKCGSCAMVVNGVPRLACDSRLSECKGGRVTLEPLRKFPVVADLVVDRAPVFERLAALQVWLEEETQLPTRRSQEAFEASRCLQCGCCLEVCPNFSTQGAFGGMAAMVPLSRLLMESPPEQRKKLAMAYNEGVFAGCGKSLACRSICPAGIDIAKLMSRSNAAALWHRL